jgi:K+-transporting ATPase ATPase C chain
MSGHLRANLWLLGLTVVICCVLYPFTLWVIGQALFPGSASGSLVADAEGTVRGSRLIAQPFSDAKYFQPRPSAASWNASASGASNYGASNPLLRDRVARTLGPLVRYDNSAANGARKDKRVGPDIEAWFRGDQGQPPLLARWADGHSTLATRWAKDDPNKNAAVRWLKDHPRLVAAWGEKNPGAPKPDLDEGKDIPWDDLGPEVLKSFAAEHPRAWPVPKERKGVDGKAENYFDAVEPDPTGKEENEIKDLQAVLFDAWLQAHAGVAGRLQQVPADMVMASGSGLDPHITLRNARFQLDDHVADAWAKVTGGKREGMSQRIEAILKQHAFTPLSGLTGEPLVNVLEVNLALQAQLKAPAGK